MIAIVLSNVEDYQFSCNLCGKVEERSKCDVTSTWEARRHYEEENGVSMLSPRGILNVREKD